MKLQPHHSTALLCGIVLLLIILFLTSCETANNTVPIGTRIEGGALFGRIDDIPGSRIFSGSVALDPVQGVTGKEVKE